MDDTHHKICDLSGNCASIQSVIHVKYWNPGRAFNPCLQRKVMMEIMMKIFKNEREEDSEPALPQKLV